MKWTFLTLAISSVLLISCGEKIEAPAGSEPEAAETPAEPELQTILQDVGAEEAAGMLASRDDLIILDIRTPEEFAEGHIAGAMNIDFRAADFAERIAALDTGKPYLFHCRSGGRSGQCIPVHEEAGFTELYHLNSCILCWIEAGNPIEK